MPAGSICVEHASVRGAAYPIDDTMNHIQAEASKPDAAFYVLEAQQEIAGFS